ncbi:DNA-directed RNA polymerase subunit alpha C-terminal domain-containing protein [Rhodococcoides fascians]|uniref:DNA-directed RNA polymerase subunit alpha C-terminal domain-containing protein n=1 Tax=Rhodococcoides fascians TaxID=1828 RepID=UPI0018AF562E|nr:sigma factor-like helix-turn-helix DNA-binding protein [Rhodococcus fascians]
MQDKWRWTVGALFPTLPRGLSVAGLGLTPRAANVLHREGVATARDLCELELSTILHWRNVGVTTIADMLYRLAYVSLFFADPGTICASPMSRENASMQIGTISKTWVDGLQDDLTLLSRWFYSVGLSDLQPLCNWTLPAWAPKLVTDAYTRIQSLSVLEIIPSQHSRTVAEIIGDEIKKLDERSIIVLASRMFADGADTLDSLGSRFSVTRERVRQIETKARSVLDTMLAEHDLLSATVDAWAALVGLIRPMDDIVQFLPALGESVPGINVPAWRVLERLSRAVEVRDGWCAVPDVASVREVTGSHLVTIVDDYGVAGLQAAGAGLGCDGESGDVTTRAWLTYCGYVVEDEYVLTRTSSVNDYAAAILSLHREALSAQELVDRFIHPRSASSLRNALALDSRFNRVDRDLWALREWGLQKYTNIRSLIIEQISKNNGQVKLADLIHEISGKFSVSASSVSAYASSAPFEQRAGVVRLAEGDPEVRKRPHETRRLMRRDNGWAYRVVITKEHHRGSGSVAPRAIAGILDIAHGETVQLSSRLGPQAVSWMGIQPTFGTIRRFLLEPHVAEGSDAFLVINDDGSFNVEPMKKLTGDPLSDVLALIGSPEDRNGISVRTAVASAIGLAPDVPVSSIIGAYTDRGDSDVAELLMKSRDCLELEPSTTRRSEGIPPSVDDILDLL